MSGQAEPSAAPAPRHRAPAGQMLIRRRLPWWAYWLIALLSLATLAGGYTLLYRAKKADNPRDRTVPSWAQLAEGVETVLTPDRNGERMLLRDAGVTLGRFTAGLGVAAGAGVVLGVLMGCYTFVEAAALPPVAFLARVPPTALLSITFVLFGLDLEYYIAMIAVGVTPVLAQTVFAAVREDVPEQLLFKARTLGASQLEVIGSVILPTILPRVLDAVRLQIGPALVFLIAAEYVNAQVGFGYQLRIQIRITGMNVMLIYALLLGVFGLVLDLILRQSRRLLSPWYVR